MVNVVWQGRHTPWYRRKASAVVCVQAACVCMLVAKGKVYRLRVIHPARRPGSETVQRRQATYKCGVRV